MDTAHGIDKHPDDHGHDAEPAGRPDGIGTDERRMHVRAYNHWVSLLKARAYPSIEDLEPGNIADFGPHSVLLDFSMGIDDPAIQFLGRALREECGVDASITHISQVPGRSLLSRLTDHYLQIIANRAPIGFEAEFVGQRGHNTLYRGILMPFSSDDDTIDFIYGVINWKEMVDAETQASLNAEIEEACRTAAPRHVPSAPVWADGPSAQFDAPAPDPIEDVLGDDAGLWDHLAHARAAVVELGDTDTRSRLALYRTLDRAYGFAEAADRDVEGYAELLEDCAIKAQARAPMTPIVKLVFGADYDKTRLTEFAAVLSHARRIGIPSSGFGDWVAGFDGGIKGIVKAERAARRPAVAPDRYARAAAELRARPSLAQVAIDAGDSEFVVLLGRSDGSGGVDIVASIDGLTDQAVRRAAA
ncbi:PAS domain-containing protein [Sphingomonas japonica]|uniref:Uncharacterized protein n=1 Tax=Sphingomonas japonica TaxID=511662 RepID=A0ABX0U243_9SPHN|nr:hypothetical protein [Sphingomonas japonica]NIJ24638.1 hypothetical protein [Sphingomonas japonica]